MFVMGMNHKKYDNSLKIVSNASCTTNCLASLAKVNHENFGIAVGKVIPELNGELKCCLLCTYSTILDLTFYREKAAKYDDIKKVVKRVSEGPVKDILGYIKEQVVSCDFDSDVYRSIFHAGAGIALNDNFLKHIFLYENEYGYNNRVVDLMAYMASKE
ncbi:glyceraldehyde-3-phosphate dehydrogenase-like [Rattus norvegicus]|uniref:glyceraldehyde-3-phosphate dehydrogenase-like n=1 Tax=Rattus norvegicus TaxID=10116 RepID=UPI002FD83F52